MDKKMNTIVDFEFYDGTSAQMTLTFYALYQLKAKNKALYERYNRIMAKQSVTEELEMISVLYTAYVCANLNDENLMTEEEFIMKCGSDRIAVRDAVQGLTQPKKQ